MLERKSVQTVFFVIVFILVIYLLGSAISLTTQKPIDRREAKPAALAGVEVTITNKSTPNANPKAVLSDKDGNFDFGLLPAGTYILTVRLVNSDLLSKQRDVETPINLIRVTIEGTTEGSMVRGWDPKTKKPVELTVATSQKGEARSKMTEKMTAEKMSPQMRQEPPKTAPDIVFTTDGKQRLKGAVHDTKMSAIQNMR